MESRHPSKNLSKAHSGKNAYAENFPGPENLGPQKVEHDYNLIFNNSSVSSIPVLDLPEDGHFVDISSSELDYSHVFRGLNDDQAIGDSYQDFIKSSSNVRTQSATRYPLNGSDSERSTLPKENQLLTSEALFQSIDDKRHFKISYHKTRAESKDGASGTIHVTQCHPEPGFSYLVDESTMQESKVDKPYPSVTGDIRPKLDCSDGILENKYTKKGMPHLHRQKSSRREGSFRTRLCDGGSSSSDRLLNAHGINLTTHPTNERLPPRVTANLENNDGFTKRSEASNFKALKSAASQHAADDNSLPFSGEEFDVNSAAAVSSAALKDAIQKAQEIMRIAKKMVERKMGGLRNRSDRIFEDGLRVKDREENSITHEGNKTVDINAKGTYQTEVGNSKIAKLMDKHEFNANERNSIIKETLIKQEIIVEKEEEDAHELGSTMKKLHADVTEKESAESVDKVREYEEMERPLIFQEDGNHVKNGTVSQQKIEYEMKYESHELKDIDFEKMIHITQKQDQSKQENSQQENMEKITANSDEIREYGPGIICDEDIEEEIFEDACEWLQNEDEPIHILDNDTEGNATYMAEVTERGRRPARIHVPTNEEKRSIDFHNYEGIGQKFGELNLIANKNGFKSHGYEKYEDKQIGTNEIEVLQHAQYESGVMRKIDSWSHDTNDRISETQGTRQASMIDESSKTDFVDKATNNVNDLDLENSKAEHGYKYFKSNINPDNDPQIPVIRYIENDYAFAEGGNHCYKEAVKSRPDMSDGEVQRLVIMKDFKEYSRPIVSSINDKVIQVDEEIKARRNTQMNGKSLCKTVTGEEEETKSVEEMKPHNIMEVNDDTLKVFFAMEGTETKKEKSKALEKMECLGKVYEESKRERQREIDRIAVGRIIQEARDRAFAGAREKAEMANVERATTEVQQGVMAETRGKLKNATTAVKLSAENASIEAKLRSERAAVERATEEARERALEKALSQRTVSRTQVFQRPDDTYIESAQRSKARLERQERIMERVAKALAEKNMRDLLAQKEEAEKNRLAESLDAQIKRWSTGKEGNLRALLSTLQYILGPGSGWQPISLTDIITSSAVKKAYRKATLYIHPDKLQQRGASIREKYICEKVFDLLKVGWARFNSEER